MDDTLKQRIVGLCILVFLAVVFVPFLFDGTGLKKEQSVRGEFLDLPNTQQPEQFTTVLTLNKPPVQSTTVPPLHAHTPSHNTPTPLPKPSSNEVTPIQRLPNNTQPTVRLEPLPQSHPKPEPKPIKPKAESKPSAPVKPKVKSKPSQPVKPKSVKPKPIQAKPSVAPKSGWLVQVGGFSNKQNALSLKKKLDQQGFNAFVKTNSAGNFFRVRVGVYSTKEKALKARAKLAELHKVKPILVKYKN